MTEAKNSANAAIAKARAERDAQYESVQRSTIGARQDIYDKARALDAAKSSIPGKALANPLTHNVEALVSEGIGEHLGEGAAHVVGAVGTAMNHYAALIGAVAPTVFRAGKAVLANPSNYRNAAIGANASNPLLPK